MTKTIDELKLELINMGKTLFQRGLSNGSAGNLSLRGPNDTYIVTPTGCSLGDLEPSSLSVLHDMGGGLS